MGFLGFAISSPKTEFAQDPTGEAWLIQRFRDTLAGFQWTASIAAGRGGEGMKGEGNRGEEGEKGRETWKGGTGTLIMFGTN